MFQSARGIDIASDLSLPSNNIIAGNHLEDITEDGISVLAKQFKDSVISSNVMNRVGEIGIYIRTGNTSTIPAAHRMPATTIASANAWPPRIIRSRTTRFSTTRQASC